MKNILFTAFLSAIVLQAFAQQHDFSCPMDGPGNAAILNQLNNVQFFSKTTCATPLYLNCNFVFLTRDDGTGTFPPNDPFTISIIDEIVKRMNDRWERVEDTDNCSPGESYPYDSNIRVNVNTHYIANTDAWDYYARAQQMTDYSFADFCPADIDNNSTMSLSQQMTGQKACIS